MSQTDSYEDLVLGSGAGGKLLSWHLARSGRRVAVVERRYIGGSCPNTNCLPSKNEIWSAKVADLLKHAAAFGIVTGNVKENGIKAIERYGPYELSGDPAIMRLLDHFKDSNGGPPV